MAFSAWIGTPQFYPGNIAIGAPVTPGTANVRETAASVLVQVEPPSDPLLTALSALAQTSPTTTEHLSALNVAVQTSPVDAARLTEINVTGLIGRRVRRRAAITFY